VNDKISFGKAQIARNYAIQKLEINENSIVLDSGTGPGSTSRLILSTINPAMLVGLDGSVRQLNAAKTSLAPFNSGLNLVRGSFEYLPFKDGAFNVIITCYALRDSLNLSQSLTEYSRVCSNNGAFADVDIGKPDNALKCWGSVLYIRYLMPVLAKATIWTKMKGNPWRMI
jgi:demethylmenaquinone methyltransferase/2-methoxy-6-polyprenyl-1,4-benzoquinol methylase